MQNDKEELKLIHFLIEDINLTKNRIKNANEQAIDIEIDLLNQQVLSLYSALKQYKNASSLRSIPVPPIVEKTEAPIPPAPQPKPAEQPREEEKKPIIVEAEKPVELKPEPQSAPIKVEETMLPEEKKATEQILEIKEIVKPEAIKIEYNTTTTEQGHEEKADLTLNQKLQSNSESLNDKFAKQHTVKNLSDKLKLSPISDLRSGISLNQKVAFIKQLFGDDDKEYKQVVTFLNNSKNFSEAKFYIQQEIIPKYKWDEANPLAEEFMELVYRKFL